ncbi:hypothetical protein ABOONEI_2763 [Aciduliprofundum boonei T469]|nr:hypothetical protein ABOONEI_261 [Aciduliprofundum boonei T469]EDY35315.1 hypothetical protein ABOONEI_2763 [Aciduliprofundum boonei T469]
MGFRREAPQRFATGTPPGPEGSSGTVDRWRSEGSGAEGLYGPLEWVLGIHLGVPGTFYYA